MIKSLRFYSTFKPNKRFPLTISDEIQQALNEKKPIVSLESTIITHGLPYPRNLDMAIRVEKVIRDNGAIPATCSFLNGNPLVGMNVNQLTELAESKKVNKVSRRDIGYTIANNLHGGTTIASTMILSHHAGIKIFATGGLGGVHKNGQTTMDISADLTELGRTPVSVVCAGPKSILDINLTMEYLETQGVFVGTYNDDNRLEVEIPGFYCRDSGVKSPYSFNSFERAASVIHNSSFLNSGNLFCIPPPKETALKSEFINSIIKNANEEALHKGIKGKELTPFLLSKIAKDTNGKSVDCNIDFVLHNAFCASQIAKELSNLETGIATFQPSMGQFFEENEETNVKGLKVVDPVDTVLIGSVALDSSSTLHDVPKMQDSNIGSTNSSIGGVGYNISLAYNYSTIKKSRLISVIGDDLPGKAILKELNLNKVDTSAIMISKLQTAQYTSIHDIKGELILACADMTIVEQDFSKHIFEQLKRSSPKQIIIDCNLSPIVQQKVLDFVENNFSNVTIIVEPTSSPKAKRLSNLKHRIFPHNSIKLITPTKAELDAIYESFEKKNFFDDFDQWFPLMDSLGVNTEFRERIQVNKILRKYLNDGTFQQSFKLLGFFQNILVKLGKDGVLSISITTNSDDYKSIPTISPYKPQFMLVSKGKQVGDAAMGVVIQYYPIPNENKNLAIKSVTGAGDSFLGLLASRLVENNWLSPQVDDIEKEWYKWESIYKAQFASGLSIQSELPISKDITKIFNIENHS